MLGRLAWLAQTRMDLLHYTSLLASGQSEPRPGHEKALRQVLRFVAADSRVGQHFPISDSAENHLNEKEVIVYSDAAFAPMRAFERRSISGAVLIYRQVTLKCFSRHQQAVSLSSCEAELHALQAAVQEAIGLARTLAFVLKSLKLRKDLPALDCLEEGECPLQIQLRTDSLSGKQLLESYDLQKKSRHIEIRLCWLRKLLGSGLLDLAFVRGDLNLSDMFTKCVGQALFQRFREAIGFATHDLSLSVLVTRKSQEDISELFEDLEGKPVGSVSKLIPRFCEMFQVREKIRKGPRCILCGDLLSQDFGVDGIHDSAAISGSTGFSLSGVTVTQLLTMSDSEDDDRRSRREEREEGPPPKDSGEGTPKPDQKKRRRKSSSSKAKPLEESTVAEDSKDPEEKVEAPAEEPAEEPAEPAEVSVAVKPPVKRPPVSPDAKPVKGKKGKGKGKGKKGKSKGKEFNSPRSRPRKPSEPVSPPTQGSREVLQELQSSSLGQSKGKLRLPKSGFSQENPKRYRCDFCRKRGHLSRNCPAITFRVSLSEGAMVHQKAQEKVREDDEEEEEDKGPEILVTTADPGTLPDAAIRLVERRAVRASLKEEQDRLKQHEAEANEILRREKERKDRERKGQAHEVSEKEKKFLAKEAKKKKNTKEKKNVLKDKGVVKAKKAVKSEVRTPEAKKPEAKKPVVEEEYSYYTSPSQEPEAKPVPKVEDGKRKKAAPKLVAKKQKAKPPTPPKSSSEPEDDEGEEEGLLTDDFPPEGEDSTSPTQESELFEAEPAVPRREVGAPKRTEVMPKKRPQRLRDPQQKPPKRLIDDKAEMDCLRELGRASCCQESGDRFCCGLTANA